VDLLPTELFLVPLLVRANVQNQEKHSLDVKERGSSIRARQNNGPHAAEDEEAHARLLGSGPPFVLLLEVDEGIDGEAGLRDRKGEDDAEEEWDLPVAASTCAPRTGTFVPAAAAAFAGTAAAALFAEAEHCG
jgi:hypothetical protein